MNARPDEPQGTELLVQELKEEAGRLAHHPIAEVRRLEHVVEEGDSPTTPLLLMVVVAVAAAVAVAVVVALAFVAYYSA